MVDCLKADLNNDLHCSAIMSLLNTYSTDIMGGGERLSDYTNENLIKHLREFPTTKVFLAKIESDFVGLAICFEGFSTFNCQKLLNIHDFVVHPKFRRKGVGCSLLMFVDQCSRAMGFCKLTLEVLEGNHAAKALYTAMGFESYELDADTGHALFWQKKLE
jgi:ribosomal protein S18 acetylase RimI-like enzyme